MSFHVQLENGRRQRCHQDQLLSRTAEDNEAESEVEPVPVVSSSLGSLILPGPLTGVRNDHGDQETDWNCESETNIHDQSSDTSTDQPTETSTELPDSNVRSSDERRYPLCTRIPREHFEPGLNLMIFCVCMYIDVYACILMCMHVYWCVHNIVYDICLYIGACVYHVCFIFYCFLYVPSYGGRNVIILYDWSVM